jgi:hypothetical protein
VRLQLLGSGYRVHAWFIRDFRHLVVAAREVLEAAMVAISGRLDFLEAWNSRVEGELT